VIHTHSIGRIRALGAGLAVAVLAACGGGGGGGGASTSGNVKTGPGEDASTKTISLGVLTPLSGQVAVIGKPLTRGQEVYFKALNDSGGINGWKVNLVERDTLYNPQTQVQQYNAIVNQVAFFAQSLGSPTTLAIQPLADQQKVLIGAATQSGSWVTDPVMIAIGNPYSVDIANGIDWIVNKQGKKSAKIGIIYQNDEYGQDGLRGYEAALNAYHFNDVARATYNATDTDFSSQVLKMKSAGADYVVLTAIPTPAGTIVGTGAALGYTPKWLFQGPAWTQFLMTKDGTLNGTATPIKAVVASTVDVLGYQAQWGDTSVPGMAKFIADHDKYAVDQEPDYYYEYGYVEAEVEAAIIKKAINNGDITRSGLLDAKLHLGNVNLGGLQPDVNYTPSLGPASRSTGISAVDLSTPGFLKLVQNYFESDAAKNIRFPYS
jgi:ABC-type branched-subunit amino acid transport system substrate-binding protein